MTNNRSSHRSADFQVSQRGQAGLTGLQRLFAGHRRAAFWFTFALMMGVPMNCVGQIRPIARCIEFPFSNGSSISFVAHFDYINYNQVPTTIPTNTASNFLDPTRVITPGFFTPGYHPDIVRVLASAPAGGETWYLAGSSATAFVPGSRVNGVAVNPTPTCPATFVAPPALTFAQPGVYTHQYLGQIDSGPAPDARTFAVLALTSGGSPFTFSNLQYLPNDPANPSHALNSNSIYGDVTVSSGPVGAYSTVLQLSVDGTVLTDGMVLINH